MGESRPWAAALHASGLGHHVPTLRRLETTAGTLDGRQAQISMRGEISLEQSRAPLALRRCLPGLDSDAPFPPRPVPLLRTEARSGAHVCSWDNLPPRPSAAPTPRAAAPQI